ncbi:hypothetical protein BX600DRAFT_518792 [Xylariales sp. PMI_506]|nr:hypothetical protein BX600DRAFT_518792 [Xylariales sp. PMI_506]
MDDDKEGFAAAAAWMASDADNEALIYRKFDDLGSRNLLYLQCEVLLLQKRLAAIDKDFARFDADITLKDAARRWEKLVELGTGSNPNPKAKEYMGLVLELRVKIKEYHEGLILQSQIANLGRPSSRALEASRAWMHGGRELREDGSKMLPVLGGLAKDYLDQGDDLVALKSHADVDFLSRTLRAYWPSKNQITRDGVPMIHQFDEKSVSLAVTAISIVVAAVLLVGSITAFYFIETPSTKLILIYVFTAAFALSVGMMTNARRAEIFAATAAYVAVLVVFVSNGNLSSSSSTQTTPGT